jgi:multidrug efflux pump
VTIPGGSIDVGTQAFMVRVAGEFTSTDVIGEIVVKLMDGRPVYVRDVATVDFGFRDRSSYARLDGDPVVTLDVVKRSGENIIAVADAVKAAVEAQRPAFPPTTSVIITSDQSEDIRAMVASLENNIISGLILVVAVLLFFLGVRNSGFVALSIPLSMLLSFIVMKLTGMTMNMIVLFSLILALGMLVDNAIVVVENIYRHIEQGHENFDAARLATGEVAMPIIASTMTTLGAFMPLLFWPGIVGEFMGYLPKTLIITLSSSLFVALVIIPPLCAMFMKLDSSPRRSLRPAARWALLALAGGLLLALAGSSVLGAVLLAATAVAVYAVHTTLLSRVGRWFQDRGHAAPHRRVRASPALGPRPPRTHRDRGGRAARHVDGAVPFPGRGHGVLPGVHSAGVGHGAHRRAQRNVGDVHGRPGPARGIVARGHAGHGGRGVGGDDGQRGQRRWVHGIERRGQRHDQLRGFRPSRERRVRDAGAAAGGVGAGMAGAEFRVEKPQNGPPSGKPVNIEIVGPEVEELKLIAERVMATLKADPVFRRLEGLENDMARGRPELVIEVDRERAALYELSTSQVGTTVRTAIQGAEAAKFRSGKDEYDIVVRLAEPYREDLESLRDLTVMADGRQVPLLSVARWQVEEGLGTVRRKDLDRVATVSSDVRAGEQSNAVLADVRAALAPVADALPPGTRSGIRGSRRTSRSPWSSWCRPSSWRCCSSGSS